MWTFYGFYLLCDGKQNIFGLWTEQDIWGRHLGFSETLINTFPHFLTQATYKLIENRTQVSLNPSAAMFFLSLNTTFHIQCFINYAGGGVTTAVTHSLSSRGEENKKCLQCCRRKFLNPCCPWSEDTEKDGTERKEGRQGRRKRGESAWNKKVDMKL